MNTFKKRGRVVFIAKIIMICAALGTSLLIVLYAPKIPPLLKPLFPLRMRWTEGEIVEQAIAKKYERDYLALFYRDPERTVPEDKNIIVAPADGTVKVIKSIDGRSRIVIYLSWWDIHVQRVPLGGIITDIIDSRHKDEEDFKCKDCYQRITEIDSKIGRITVKQVTNGFASRIRTHIKKGQNAMIGERLGAILLGSHVVIEFPNNLKINVKKGDQVYGGETIIARY